jgi:hypothetical protein
MMIMCDEYIAADGAKLPLIIKLYPGGIHGDNKGKFERSVFG